MSDYTELESQNKKSGFCQKHRVLFVVFFALAIGAVVFALSLTLSSSDSDSSASLPALSFSDAFNSSFSPRYASVQWLPLSDDYVAWNTTTGIITIYKAPTFAPPNTVSIANTSNLFYPGTSTPLNIYSFQVSGEEFVLFQTDFQQVYRWSSLSKYFILNVSSGELVEIANGVQLQYAEIDPSNRYLAYVLSNNIYIYELNTKLTRNITSDGVINSVINGICDWVYEEEVFSQTSALRWSANGNYLAWLRFMETPVPQYQFPIYDMPYNEEYVYKYPKAGMNNSVVDLFTYSTLTESISQPAFSNDPEQYFIEFKFFGDRTVVVKIMPRLQQSWQLWAVDASEPEVSELLNSDSSAYYLEPQSALTYLSSSDRYVDLISNGEYNHIVLFDMDGNRVKNLTDSYTWGVYGILGVHAPTETIFFQTTLLGSPNVSDSRQRAIWAVSPTIPPYRLLNTSTTNSCKDLEQIYQTASFSANGGYFIFNERACPRSSLYRFDSPFASLMSVLNSNDVLFNAVASRSMPKKEFVTIEGAFGPMNAYRLISNKECGSKRPVLIYAYGGPGAQEIDSQYPSGTGTRGWHNYLVSSLGFIVYFVDPIGTGYRGDKWQKSVTYKNLGVYETQDLIQAADYIKTQPCVDPDRIGYWGWSYGGYLASMLAFESSVNTTLKLTMAVAPVADWQLYDTIYTERYMQTPILNSYGYNSSSVLHRILTQPQNVVENFLLVHGTSDDNVHFQNAALIAEDLQLQNIQFEEMVYTNRAHSLRLPDNQAPQHLYRLLTNFLLRSFDMEIE